MLGFHHVVGEVHVPDPEEAIRGRGGTHAVMDGQGWDGCRVQKDDGLQAEMHEIDLEDVATAEGYAQGGCSHCRGLCTGLVHLAEALQGRKGKHKMGTSGLIDVNARPMSARGGVPGSSDVGELDVGFEG